MHQGNGVDQAPVVGLGLENSDLLVKAFDGCRNLAEACERLGRVLQDQLVPLELVAKQAVEEAGGHYNGMDASANPSLAWDHSLVRAFESLLGGDSFGSVGTLVSSCSSYDWRSHYNTSVYAAAAWSRFLFSL